MQPLEFVSRENAEFIERLYEQYRRDPRTLDEKWRIFFAGFDLGLGRRESIDSLTESTRAPGSAVARPSQMGIYDLVHSYRELGHFIANLDPLGHNRPTHPLLDLSNFGIDLPDMDQIVGTGGFQGPTDETLGDLLDKLRITYCGTVGVEFTNITDKAQRHWLQQQMEPTYNRPTLMPAHRKAVLFQLIAGEEFEKFLGTRPGYMNQKRFSLEGALSLVPLLNFIVEDAAALGAEKVIMGMAHRGRLNVLAHVLNKPYEVILSEFMGTSLHDPQSTGDGDVKYHLGYANERPIAGSTRVKVSLCPNPSHLELIGPIMQGIVRAQQDIFGDAGRNRVVPVLMHGDAAFTGQGVVSETLNLSELHGYRTGGTIHIIVNNQIGFTTDPSQGRFTPYPTDVAKMIQAPIFHVNGDDPEAAVHAARLAIAFRQQFKSDVMIDLWCYRRHGHNEQDEPSFTQPVMYRQIEGHAPVWQIYANRLIAEGHMTAADLEAMRKTVQDRLEAANTLAKEARPREKIPRFGGVWKGLGRAGKDWSARTAVSRENLRKIAEVATAAPEGFTVHPKLKKLLAGRLEAVNTGKGIDFGCGEMLALGSLLQEGQSVRFVGQDAERGTFSHRHAVLHDYNTGATDIPLARLAPEGRFHILNTMLSEFAVLGFEWGYASADPRNLVVWEAQFGDFVNGAQPIVDQILAASESKWGYMNGLVILLPHGYEGMGPEHSNGYVERFLQLCAEDNMQVCQPSTPAQYFHFLRRQLKRSFRKPLVMMMPKKLLRYEPASSRIEEFSDMQAQLVIDDPADLDRSAVRRLLLCSGKVYYSLLAMRTAERIEDTAIVRVEQLYPFPEQEIRAVLSKYRQAETIAWVQEEPRNRGAFHFIERRSRHLLGGDMTLHYFGRDESASPATGWQKMHEIEEQELLTAALDIPARRAAQAARAEDAERELAQAAVAADKGSNGNAPR